MLKTFLTSEVRRLAPSGVLQAIYVTGEQERPHVRLPTDVIRFDPGLGPATRGPTSVSPGTTSTGVLVLRQDVLGLDADAVDALLPSSASAQSSRHAPRHHKVLVGFWACEADDFASSLGAGGRPWTGAAR
jgi:hypothetical protein